MKNIGFLKLIHDFGFGLERSKKLGLMVIIDVISVILALWSSYALRLSDIWPEEFLLNALPLFILIPVASILIFIKMGLYRALLRYMGLHLLYMVFISVSSLIALSYVVVLFFEIQLFPRSVPLIFGLVALLYLAGSRLLIRYYYYWLILDEELIERVLIYGAGKYGTELLRSLSLNQKYKVVGFLESDEALAGKFIEGVRVHSDAEIDDVLSVNHVDSIFLALPNLEAEKRRVLINKLARYPVRVKSVPSISDIIAGKSIGDMTDVDVNDLLGRNVVLPDKTLIEKSIRNKNIFISGAGGSIGSEIANQCLLNGAARLILLDHSEYALYSVEKNILQLVSNHDIKCEVHAVLGTVTDQEKMQSLLSSHKIDTIYHAAAYKHVPLVEKNVGLGLFNNVIGTQAIALAAEKSGVERFVLISTDKAVRPTNFMGASKRLSELVIQDLSIKTNSPIIYSSVRFGNVLGSSGSVIPLFKEQIRNGGPLTVTHPEITRYFMSIAEAVSLVIQAGSMGVGGDVFLLDMGEPVRIFDMAKKMIHLSGLRYATDDGEGDIKIIFTGLRPGEKLYEELLIGGESSPTQHPMIRSANENFMGHEELYEIIDLIKKGNYEEDLDSFKDLLKTEIGYTSQIY